MNVLNDVSDKLERLEAFEERAGVKLEALFARLDHQHGWTVKDKRYPSIKVNLQVHPVEGNSLKSSISIVADGYDASGRLVSTTSGLINKDSFFGFETLSLAVDGVPAEQISKIRVYPKILGH